MEGSHEANGGGRTAGGVAAISAGKAPGHDKLTVDMLKLLFWDERPVVVPPPNISLDPSLGLAGGSKTAAKRMQL